MKDKLLLKNLHRQVNAMRQEMRELKWYWKVRCKERHTYGKGMSEIKRILARCQDLERTYAKTLGRKKMTVIQRGKELYPVFMSDNDINRLRQLLGRVKK